MSTIVEQFKCRHCQSVFRATWPNPALYDDVDFAPDDLLCVGCGGTMHHMALEMEDGADPAQARLSSVGQQILAEMQP